MSRRRNKYYDRKLKLQAVQDYLGGGGSLRTICKKHGIKDKKQLRNWIKWYFILHFLVYSRKIALRTCSIEEHFTIPICVHLLTPFHKFV